MKVLIVGKTRRGTAACTGAIGFDGRSLRLVAPPGEEERWGHEFDVGGVWEVEGRLPDYVVPPHVENFVVTGRRRLAPMPKLVSFIERNMPPTCGGPEELFDGALKALPSGALCIEPDGIPSNSTAFWRPDRPLARRNDQKRIRYHYITPHADVSLAFVGYQEPPPEIPAGTLVRVSLSHWWRRPDRPEEPLRCWLQLSGWFELPAAAGMAAIPAAAETAEPTTPAPLGTIEQIRHAMRRVFGYSEFKPLQEEVIRNVLARRDTLGVMPTGAGKSLCFQLPALLPGGLTVVVSPLIALMQDQVDQLRTVGVCAVTLNSMMSHAEYVESARRIRSGQARLLYIAPESLLRPETLVMLDEVGVKLLTIDEAHCISEWGHDFRPEYRQLRSVRDRFPTAVCLALTATATDRVRSDIRRLMGINERDTLIAPFDRSNLHLAVHRRTGGIRQVTDFLERHADESGIIYCRTRKSVDLLVARLKERGYSALPYHAGMEDDARRENQRQFLRDRVPIIVATNAFGMGINKSNIRFVLHTFMPDSIETYYQQIGRAGRDGLPSECVMLFSRGDIAHAHHFIEEGAESERQGKLVRLSAMIRYAQATACRRAVLVTYFGDPPPAGSCNTCDNCHTELNGQPRENVSEEAQLFLRCMEQTKQAFGLTYIVDVLRGSRSSKVLSRKHNALPAYGTGSHRPIEWWRLLADRLVEHSAVEVDSENGVARIAPAGRAVMAGEPFLAVMDQSHALSGFSESPKTYDALLFAELRQLRTHLAAEANVPPYVVFSDRTLTEMAVVRPLTRTAFHQIHGVGERKAEAYAEPFIDVIRRFVPDHGEDIAADRAVVATADDVNPGRCEESARAFQSGMTVDQIVARWLIKRERVLYHFSRFVREGGRLDPDRLLAESRLDAETRTRCLSVLERLGWAALRPAFDEMGGLVPFPELRILALYLSCRQGVPA